MRIDRLIEKMPELKGKKLDELASYGLVIEKIEGKNWLRTRNGF